MNKNQGKPLVSIIIPTHNSQKTIKQCLQSIKKQTYKKIETLIVDRNSTDATTHIAKKFKTKVIPLKSERSKAKNYAAKKANGDFLLFIDSDMTLNPKVVEECVDKCLQTNADAIVIPEEYVGQGLLGQYRKIEKTALSIEDSMKIPRFFRKKAFIKVGGFDEKLVCGEDFDFFQRFRKTGHKTEEISSHIIHFEGNPSLFSFLFKAYYYGKTIPELIKKNPSANIKRYLNLRLASVKNTGTAFKSTRKLLGFTVTKLFEYTAYLLGISAQLLHEFAEKYRIIKLKNKILQNKVVVANSLIILLIAITVFRNFLFTSEWPGGGDVLGFISRAYLYGKDLRWLYMWRPYSFGFIEGINSMDFFLMLLYLVFRDPAWTIKAFIFLSYLVAGFSMYFFSYKHTYTHVAALSAALVYILNQWLFSQLTEAHVQIVFSYALAPLIFFLLDRALQTGKLRDILLSSLSLTVFVTGFHPECIVIYGVFLAFFVVFFVFFPAEKSTVKTRFLRFLKVSLPSTLIVFSLSSFFFIPFLMNVRSPYLHPSYEYPLEDSFACSYHNLTDAFTLRAVERWGYISVVDVYSGLGLPDFPVYNLLFLIFIVAYCVLLVRRDRYTVFFAFSTTLSIFVAKGPHPPFGDVFIWAWFNISHFAIFRAADRWVMMAVFSHAFFMSLLVYHLTKYVKAKTHLRISDVFFRVKMKTENSVKVRVVKVSVETVNKFLKKFHKILYFSAVTLLVLIFLSGFLSCFFFFSRGLQVYTPPKPYREPYKWVASRNDDFKVVSVSRSPSEWGNSATAESDFACSAMRTTLGWGHDIGFDSSFIHDKPVLQDGGWNFKPRKFVNYLRFQLARKGLTKDLLKILGTFSYKYVVIPPYVTEKTREFFLNQEGYTVVYNNQSALVLQNNYAQPRIFAANRKAFILGGLETFQMLCKVEGFNLNETALTFTSTTGEDRLTEQLTENAEAFIFVNSDILDLAMLSLEEGNLIYAGKYGASSINLTKYWVKSPSWSNLGVFVLGSETLTTSGKNRIEIPFEVSSKDVYSVWLRVGFAPCRGKLTIFIDGENLTEIKPEFPLWSKLAWINITNLELEKGKHFITFENDGTGYNDIDAIAIVKPVELKSRIKEVTNTLRNFSGRLIYVLEAENAFLKSPKNEWYWIKIPYEGYVIRSDSLGLNVATMATANATSSSDSFDAQCAIDGSLGTRWASEKNVLPQWLELTWNKSQTLRGVRILFENAYARAYTIQTWNGTHWINQVTVTGNDKLERIHEFAEPVETDRLLINVTAFSQYDRVSIWELEAYLANVTTSSAKITIPRKGNYMLAARVATGSEYGTFYLKMDNTIFPPIQCNSSDSQFKWYERGPVGLEAGEHTVSIGGVGSVELDEILIYSLKDEENYCSLKKLFDSPNPDVAINYTRIDSCTYSVHIIAHEPFTLIFSDTYSPFWKAFINGEELSSTTAYSIVNCFDINKTGEFTVIIRFTGQNYADIGLKVSLAAFISTIVLTIIPSNVLKKMILLLKKMKGRLRKYEKQ